MEIVFKYFPDLTEIQKEQFSRLESLYREWNTGINVISRKDIDNLAERHVLHSLGIAKFIQFSPGTKILDVGTGGGFPGIPLAIYFPEVQFHLIDSIGKKINVVKAVTEQLGLKNVSSEQVRAEQITGKYNFVISRAVTTLREFYNWVFQVLPATKNNSAMNGVIYLKGGEITAELQSLNRKYRIANLSDYFTEEFFTTKKVVHIY